MEKNDRPEICQKMIQNFRAGRWEDGENLWKELLQKDVIPIVSLREPAQELMRRGQQKLCKELIAETVKVCLSKTPIQQMEAIHLFSEFTIEHKEYADRYAQAFLKAYGDDKNVEIMAEKIRTQQMPLQRLIETLHRLLLFKQGTIVKHKSGWGVGKVTEIFPEELEMIVQLKKRPNHRMNILGAADCLLPLAPDNFEAMVAFNLETLQNEAKNDEQKLLHRIFQFCKDEISAREFKEFLCPAVIPEAEWTRWWGKARKMLLLDSYVEANSGAHSKYRLRQEPLGWEQETKTKFDTSTPLDQPQVLLDYLKHTEMRQNLNYFVGTLIRLCNLYLKKKQPEPWFALECYLVVQEAKIGRLGLKEVKEAGLSKPEELLLPDIKEIVTKDNVIAIFNNLRMQSLSQMTLDLLIQYQPNWANYVIAIFKKGTDLARDVLYKHMQKNNIWQDHSATIIDEIRKDPLGTPDGLIWLSRQVFNDKIPAVEGHAGAGLIGFFEILTILIRTGGTLKSLRQTDMVRKMNKIFSAELIKKIMLMLENVKRNTTQKNGDNSGENKRSDKNEHSDGSDQTHAAHLYTLVEQSTFLPSNFKQSLQNSLREKYPDLFTKTEHIYTTKEGLSKYQMELDDILQNKIPQNSKAIGEALGHGDLSENAELDAAREIQFMLMKKVGEMQNNIERAMLIDFDGLKTDCVCVGCIVDVINEKGNTAQYTILGPWDVDTNKGVVSFMSGIAHSLLGAKVDDVVSLPMGTCKIVKIASYQSSNDY